MNSSGRQQYKQKNKSYRGGWQLVAWLHYRSARQVREYVYVVFECWLV
eukprot:COSAG01_NODE_75833_length_192_cov_60.204301_1_plen_47_part_01